MPSFATPVYGATDEAAHHRLLDMGAAAAWRAICSHVRFADTAYGVMVMGSSATYDETTRILTIELPAENAFVARVFGEPSFRETMNEATRAALGGDIAYRAVLADD